MAIQKSGLSWKRNRLEDLEFLVLVLTGAASGHREFNGESHSTSIVATTFKATVRNDPPIDIIR